MPTQTFQKRPRRPHAIGRKEHVMTIATTTTMAQLVLFPGLLCLPTTPHALFRSPDHHHRNPSSTETRIFIVPLTFRLYILFVPPISLFFFFTSSLGGSPILVAQALSSSSPVACLLLVSNYSAQSACLLSPCLATMRCRDSPPPPPPSRLSTEFVRLTRP